MTALTANATADIERTLRSFAEQKQELETARAEIKELQQLVKLSDLERNGMITQRDEARDATKQALEIATEALGCRLAYERFFMQLSQHLMTFQPPHPIKAIGSSQEAQRKIDELHSKINEPDPVILPGDADPEFREVDELPNPIMKGGTVTITEQDRRIMETGRLPEPTMMQPKADPYAPRDPIDQPFTTAPPPGSRPPHIG